MSSELAHRTITDIVSTIPAGIRMDAQRSDAEVLVCGNQCPGRERVKESLLTQDAPYRQVGCLALCTRFGRLYDEYESYLLVPVQSEHGLGLGPVAARSQNK